MYPSSIDPSARAALRAMKNGRSGLTGRPGSCLPSGFLWNQAALAEVMEEDDH
jgi:hypothetical protein